MSRVTFPSRKRLPPARCLLPASSTHDKSKCLPVPLTIGASAAALLLFFTGCKSEKSTQVPNLQQKLVELEAESGRTGGGIKPYIQTSSVMSRNAETTNR